MTTAKRLHYDYEDYRRLLRTSDTKLEFCDGVIYAMPGGTPAHAALGARVIGSLARRLPAAYTVYSSDLSVRVDATDLSTFPDVSVICGALVPAAIDKNAATNPSVLIEVTSRSTEDYDRGDKLSHYKQLTSLRAVLFVSHRTQRVTLVQRTAAGWDERDFRSGEDVVVAEPSLAFPVDELYAGITLDPA